MTQEVIEFHYTVKNSQGEILDSSRGEAPMAFLVGTKQIVPGLEKVLVTLKVGESAHVNVASAEAYGPRHEAHVITVNRDQLPEGDIQVGMMFSAGPADQMPPFRVTEMHDAHIVLDANHPLAGIDLVFDVELTGRRAATEEELAHGHAHSGDGHHHH